jgi:phosphonatase-like hydrolase
MFSRRRALPAIAGSVLAGSAAAQPIAPAGAPALKLVVLDIGGTLIADNGEVATAMTGALTRHGIAVDADELNQWRGASKPDIVRHFVAKHVTDNVAQMTLSKTIYDEFQRDVSKAYQQVQPIPGALDTLKELKAMGLILACTTGFDRALAMEILHRLEFQSYLSALVAGDDVTEGRPAPFMLFHAMEAARVQDVRAVMAVGDTPLDLQAANNAGLAAAVGVYSGAATQSRLRQERSSAVLPSVASLPAWIKNGMPQPQCR